MPSERRRSSPEPVPGTGMGEDEVELGFVSGVFGVRGEVRLHLHNRASTLLDGEHRVILVHPKDGRRVAVSLVSRPGAGKRVLGRIAGVGDPDAAAAWMDWRIVIPAAELPALDEGEFYVWQVEGLPVFFGEERIGTVRSVHATDAAEIFEIAVDPGAAERLGVDSPLFVPSLRELVTVDVEGGRVALSEAALG